MVTTTFERQTLGVNQLLLDLENFRTGKTTSQKFAREAIIDEQGKKLVVLAKDIGENGLNPFDLPMVYPMGVDSYTMVEGNRRLTAIKLVLEPTLAEHTPLHAAFKKLHTTYAGSMPTQIYCVVAGNKKSALLWMERKHAIGLEGAGTDPWSSIAKERADALQGRPTPILDALNFVRDNPDLDADVKKILEGNKFNFTSFVRVLGDSAVREVLGISAKDDGLVSSYSPKRVLGILSDVVTVISKEKHNGKKFTVRDIDTDEDRLAFITGIAAKHPKKGSPIKPWRLQGSGSPTKPITNTGPAPKPKANPNTNDRSTLIPRSFRLKLPEGKINDVFSELKSLDVDKYRNADGVLFRVFVEFTLDEYLRTKTKIKTPLPQGKDRLIDKLKLVIADVKDSKLMTDKELKPVNIAISDKHSILSPETLNAFVHNTQMNPDPLQLKLGWNSIQLFMERVWQP